MSKIPLSYIDKLDTVKLDMEIVTYFFGLLLFDTKGYCPENTDVKTDKEEAAFYLYERYLEMAAELCRLVKSMCGFKLSEAKRNNTAFETED